MQPALLLACLALAHAATVPLPRAATPAVQLPDPAHKEFGIEKDDQNFLAANEVSVKRDPVDLSDLGEPQRQEHDTQSPESNNEEQTTALKVKAGVLDVEALLRAGLPDLGQLQNMLSADDRLTTIQLSIDRLQQTMTDQFNKLNATLEGFMASENEKKEESEKGLVSTLLKGVQGVKQEAGQTGPFQNFQQYLSSFQTNMQEAFSNFNNTVQGYITNLQQGGGNSTGAGSGLFQNIGGIQNIIGQQTNGEAGTQSDEQTPRPTIWQSLTNIWNRPGQQQGGAGDAQADTPQPAGSGPFQAFQNNPIYQGVLNLIQRPQNGTPQKPAEAGPVAQEGTNVIPAKPEDSKPEETKPEGSKDDEKPAELPPGPIQQLVQKNPIVQGIAGTVQRIQSAVRPDQPRDQEKLGFKPPPLHGGHRPAGPNTGDSDVSNGIAAEPAVKDAIPEPVAAKDQDKKVVQPSPAEVAKKD